MSVTTTQPPGPSTPNPGREPAPGPSAKPPFSFFSGRVRRVVDDTPQEMMEFYSPSTALAAVPAKRSARNTVAIIGSMVVAIFILFGVMTVDRVVVASGKIVSLTPEVVVQPINPAIVKTIAVSAGDIVRKGQLLAQLDPTYSAADNTAALDQVDRYQTEIDRLNAENRQIAYHPRQLTPGALVQEGIFAQRASAREAELRYYQGQIEAQKALQLQADANVRQYAKETGVAVDVEKMREQLEHDAVGSRLDTLSAVNARLEAERQVLSWVQQSENARQNVAALQGQLDNYNQQWFADVSQTITGDSVQLATYRDQLEHANLNYKLIDLRAEQDSTVLSVAPVSVGSVLQAGQTFFTLVPLNAPLEIDAQMTGDEAGFVYTGQPVMVKFQSFPSQEFGMGHGSVRLISADSFLTGTTSGQSGPSSAGTASNAVFTGVAPTSPFFYDVRVTLDRLALKHVPKDLHITPGMPVEADIKVGERTIWEYLVERVMPIITEGMREPT
jgi:HlyD family secretion protein